MGKKIVKILFVCLLSLLWGRVSMGAPPEISEERVSPKNIRPGDNIEVQYTLTLTQDSTPDFRGAWATVLVYKGDPQLPKEEWRLPKEKRIPFVARSSDPQNFSYKSKPAGSRILVKLTIREDQTSELSAGIYSVYAYGWGPKEFKKKIGEFRVVSEQF